jgi:hypothetical protein
MNKKGLKVKLFQKEELVEQYFFWNRVENAAWLYFSHLSIEFQLYLSAGRFPS